MIHHLSHTQTPMPLAARRCFRLAFSTGLALAASYGLGIAIPFVAPVFAVLLAAVPAPPPGLRAAFTLMLFVVVGLGIGMLLGPLLQRAPLTSLAVVALGVFISNRMAIGEGKALPATLLALGFTAIPAAHTASADLAAALVEAVTLGVAAALVSLWLVYPLFPENVLSSQRPSGAAVPVAAPSATEVHWLSLRATLIVLPAFALTLTNPTTNLPFLVKSILLGREASMAQLRGAGMTLVGSTLCGGVCAVAVWWCLGFAVELWFFTGWVLLISLILAAGAFQIFRNPMTPGFWLGSLMSMLILLGAAVQDSALGNDVYRAFLIRMTLFVLVSLYALCAMSLLDRFREKLLKRRLLRPASR
ncbi:DUF2955 domain-containing protein [Microbulbifer bruguierae]|uniref:DUF2955 domain-containing protein n=1 Tax=Microbulbifer bruguierae TaxID=3029061 RepID=A0ABY8NAM4_9GAMM|nr:DUF2955 domain-containing protein [Microbulbifer bruguierae]WGL15971.1 DUF2955 domain-containing protein [Microbulbifer bruguierae]